MFNVFHIFLSLQSAKFQSQAFLCRGMPLATTLQTIHGCKRGGAVVQPASARPATGGCLVLWIAGPQWGPQWVPQWTAGSQKWKTLLSLYTTYSVIHYYSLIIFVCSWAANMQKYVVLFEVYLSWWTCGCGTETERNAGGRHQCRVAPSVQPPRMTGGLSVRVPWGLWFLFASWS